MPKILISNYFHKIMPQILFIIIVYDKLSSWGKVEEYADSKSRCNLIFLDHL